MRSDLRDNSETISKMIQFGTVKYGIVKQLKDRTRSERDIISEQDETPSMPCSPVAECKVYSPETHTNAVNDDENADHNHNNNNNSTDNHDEEMHFPNSDIKGEMPEPYTYPEVELRKSPSPITQIPPAGPSPTLKNCDRDHLSDDHNMSENENDQERETEISNLNDEACKAMLDEAGADDVQQRQQQNHHQQNSNSRSSPPPTLPQFPAAPITIDVIQNMQMAIAQFAAKTLANGGTNNEAAMKQLAFLQQTLFNLQQQQIFQMQLIQQLQSQLAINQIKGDNQEQNEEDEDEDEQLCAENLSSQKSDDEFEEGQKDGDAMDLASQDTMMSHRRLSEEDKEAENCSGEERKRNHKESERSEDEKAEDSEECDKSTGSHLQSLASLHHNNNNNSSSSNMNGQGLDKTDILPSLSSKLDENTPLPYASDLASSIITNHDDPPSLDEPNSLEMLQKRAQEVLESASQGILAGNLADEFAFGKDKNGDCKNRNEPFFKHRCRYCGKVFGSDSALQIHIRSHTGERPFKCNVCGSRFTTKGNLKVHFQRHSQKFPHVPMNCTPIPEHLDKFHPPLLEQMSPEASPPHQPQMPPVPNVPVSLPLPFPPTAGFPGLPMYRPPLEILKSLGHYPTPFFGGLPPMPPAPLKRDQDAPTDLRKPSTENSLSEKPEIKDEPLSLRIKEERRDSEREDSLPRETQPTRRPPSPDMPLIPPPLPLANLPISSPLERSQEIVLPPEAKRSKSETPPLSIPQPPPLPASILQTSPTLLQQSIVPPSQQSPLPTQQQLPPTTTQLPSLIKREDFSQRLPLNYTKLSPDRRSPIRSPASIPRSPFLGPIKHEMTLLPRPHSNDNSWENFIEVSNTSETVKLKELMKNKKLTDPNQCVVCDRVLSCKSALQMHYRTHTGERPFKCRICGRAFTTKGNLKTHMAVHKIRPPMRNFHQCPVCHKKYSNALVLQQHIRLHTGEPTDLTPEQIQAAEIRDFPPTIMPGSFLNPFTFNFGLGGGGGGNHNGMMGSESSQGENEEGMDCSDDFDDDMSENLSNGGFSDRPKSSDDMKGMLFEQKLKIENNRPKSEASTSSAPTSPVSAINKSSPTPSDTSQGALDLTPRSSMPPHTPPNHGPPIFHARPPFGMFPNLPLFPPVSSTAQNMCSAMNSIAQSVMPSAPFNPLALSGVRGSTTCGICFKTFPCHSALEIHYRSHTKERPFKCSICDRGFTTKGNLKQHMLTHKIRDMEQDAFRNRAIKYSTEQEQR